MWVQIAIQDTEFTKLGVTVSLVFLQNNLLSSYYWTQEFTT